MTHTYKSQYPPGTVIDEGIRTFFEDFYRISDTPDAHELYADSFTPDATLFMASKKGVGREGTVPPSLLTPFHRLRVVCVHGCIDVESASFVLSLLETGGGDRITWQTC